ncbi:YqzK family protein [Metabacillus sp. 113a]|uniref:YqzK family protein n=1 Tax=Metabacillus sp. 113a TaxID=3404706 RepID=UPI003CE93339
MKRYFRAGFDMMKVFIVFTGFTILFYYAIIWINLEYQDYHRYDQPEGSALRVTKMAENEPDQWLNRLIFFYTDGE